MWMLVWALGCSGEIPEEVQESIELNQEVSGFELEGALPGVSGTATGGGYTLRGAVVPASGVAEGGPYTLVHGPIGGVR